MGLALRASGIKEVTMVDREPSRVALAQRFGLAGLVTNDPAHAAKEQAVDLGGIAQALPRHSRTMQSTAARFGISASAGRTPVSRSALLKSSADSSHWQGPIRSITTSLRRSA
jgi:threonine dehydrogenase-like Zn-dependent dehydrogenase